MMKAVASVAAAAGIPCQVSLEERMACGIGACLGCAVELRDGRMVRSCIDGPVFDAGEVVL
jgi:dihydroorotate dehydrogenase electron transfer subunit